MAATEFEPEYGERALKMPDGSYLGHLPSMLELYMNNSIYYGSSGTGKTIAIVDHLFILRNLVSRVVAFSPTNKLNNTYDGIIPQRVINSNLTHEKIDKIFEEQSEVARLHGIANDIDNLEELFNYSKQIPAVSNDYIGVLNKITKLDSMKTMKIKEAKREKKTPNEIKFIERELDQKILEKKKDLYKRMLLKNRVLIINSIPPEDIFNITILKNLDINPYLLIILEDCIEEVGIISKPRNGKPSTLELIFSQGRHHKIILIISAQDDSKLTPLIRKNSFLNVFTESTVAIHFFENKANSFTKQTRHRAQMIVDGIFGAKETGRNFKKLVWYRLGNPNNMFTYRLPEAHDKFQVGSDEFWNAVGGKSTASEKRRADQAFIMRKFK